MTFRHLLCTILSSSLFCAAAAAAPKKNMAAELRPVCDSLETLLQERTGVKVRLVLRNVITSGQEADFYFTETLGDIPWRKGDAQWFRDILKSLMPDKYKDILPANIFSKKINIQELETTPAGNNGLPSSARFRVQDRKVTPLVRRAGARRYPRGLDGRHLAIWQSHGRYFAEKQGRWKWQRPRLFGTSEDMFTQSFVLPYLIPMLENAGACVLDPRERDPQKYEVVCDNDPSFEAERTGLLRRKGSFSTTGKWSGCGSGFADTKQTYTLKDNPFAAGTALKSYIPAEGENTAVWEADIPCAGKYAVYVSYATLPESTDAASYTVYHRGGSTSFSVNQRMGGGTWTYLGTFPFDEVSGGRVVLSTAKPEGVTSRRGSLVTADAVRFGGGMGKFARGDKETPEEEMQTSGMPSYMEGALYNLLWAGADSTITAVKEGDYTNDIVCRGAWVSNLCGGSAANPREKGKRIPIDLSLAFHSDAGYAPNDSIIGTLAIYTLKANGKRELPDGTDRMAGRELADAVQTQVVEDIRSLHTPLWSRRGTWDRSYSECRTTSVPGMILESLSHQNFEDMKYGHDPAFKFTMARAVYKGILKFLSNRYGRPYTVQPLPVKDFSVSFASAGTASLKWMPAKDALEPTATPSGYTVWRREDDGEFIALKDIASSGSGLQTATDSIAAGRIYSYRITAWNKGGCSFPSEVLSIGRPDQSDGTPASPDGTVLIVNNFYRVSAPAWFDTPTYAGFNAEKDAGVPDGKDISLVGDMFEYRRWRDWADDDEPGFGASHNDQAGRQIAGNTFDYAYVHGKAIMSLGKAFCSASCGAFCRDTTLTGGISATDLICGKQLTTCTGGSHSRYTVFPAALRSAVRYAAEKGIGLVVSGSYIATDVWDGLYPAQREEQEDAEMKAFIQETLGYKLITGSASRNGTIMPIRARIADTRGIKGRFSIRHLPNEVSYCAESPDGLRPVSENAGVIMRYADTGISAGIFYDAGTHKAVSIGFPIEAISDEGPMRQVLGSAISLVSPPARN